MKLLPMPRVGLLLLPPSGGCVHKSTPCTPAPASPTVGVSLQNVNAGGGPRGTPGMLTACPATATD